MFRRREHRRSPHGPSSSSIRSSPGRVPCQDVLYQSSQPISFSPANTIYSPSLDIAITLLLSIFQHSATMSSSFANALFGPVLDDQARTTSPSSPRRSNSSSSSSSSTPSNASDSSARARSSFKEVATASLRKLSPSSSSAYLSQRFAKKSPSPPRQVVTFTGPPSYEESIGSDEGESSKDFDTKITTTTNSSTANLLPSRSPVQQ